MHWTVRSGRNCYMYDRQFTLEAFITKTSSLVIFVEGADCVSAVGVTFPTKNRTLQLPHTMCTSPELSSN